MNLKTIVSTSTVLLALTTLVHARPSDPDAIDRSVVDPGFDLREAAPTITASGPPRIRLAQTTVTAIDIATIGNVAVAPLAWSGKLLFTMPVTVQRDGKTVTQEGFAHCTAQFVAPRILLTAAHCLMDQDGTEFNPDRRYFLLQYQSGSWSKQYKISCVAFQTEYIVRADKIRTAAQLAEARDRALAFDFALMRVAEDSTTGFYELSPDWWGRISTATRTGYPAAVLQGQVVQQDEGMVMRLQDIPLYAKRNSTRAPEVALISYNPNILGGSSGGAIVGNFNVTGARNANYLVSITSHGPQRSIFGRPGDTAARRNADLGSMTVGPMLPSPAYTELLNAFPQLCPDK